jgi:hypothetical protein
MKSRSLLITASLLFVFSFTSFSQEKRKEINFGTRSFSDFNVKYKFGNERRLFRIHSTLLTFEHSKPTMSDDKENDISVALGLGMEFPRKVNEKIELTYGFSINGDFSNIGDEQGSKYKMGTFAIFGASYFFNDYLKMGVELTPGVYYIISERDTYSEAFGFLARSNWAEINVGFVF